MNSKLKNKKIFTMGPLLFLTFAISFNGPNAKAQTVPCLEALSKERDRLLALESTTHEEIRVLKVTSREITLPGEEGLVLSAKPENRRNGRADLRARLSRIAEKLKYLQYFSDTFEEALNPDVAETVGNKLMVAGKNGKYTRTAAFPLVDELYTSFNKRMPSSQKVTPQHLVERLTGLMGHQEFCAQIPKVFDFKYYTSRHDPQYTPASNPRSLLILLLSDLNSRELEGSTGFFEEPYKSSVRKQLALEIQKKLGLIPAKDEAPLVCASSSSSSSSSGSSGEKDLESQLQEIKIKVEEWDKQNKIFIASVSRSLEQISAKMEAVNKQK